ncbi:hypothetical protein GGX14DRAFT_408169 [Mycena pura]|uniref:Uncharacterized protein n=1 Tax=Mycena pura TaxID=153505 RepID=A0AAD6ULK1_9AGAR|nr:hypothetical protein GGX14DRAFT_408169 [Mycena pura]
MAENGLTTPERIEQQRRAAKCTPTKRAMAQVLHDDLKLSFVEIVQRSPFKQIQPRTINDNYNLKINGAQLAEAVDRVESGEMLDGAEVQWVMFPNIALRTVQHTLTTRAQLRGFVRHKKPDLQLRHLEQRKAMYYRNEVWTDDAVFRTGVFINSDESKVNLAASDRRRWARRRRGHHVLVEQRVQRHLAHGRAKVKVNIWGAIGPNGVSKLVRIKGNLTAVQYVQILEDGLCNIPGSLPYVPPYLRGRRDNLGKVESGTSSSGSKPMTSAAPSEVPVSLPSPRLPTSTTKNVLSPSLHDDSRKEQYNVAFRSRTPATSVTLHRTHARSGASAKLVAGKREPGLRSLQKALLLLPVPPWPPPPSSRFSNPLPVPPWPPPRIDLDWYLRRRLVGDVAMTSHASATWPRPSSSPPSYSGLRLSGVKRPAGNQATYSSLVPYSAAYEPRRAHESASTRARLAAPAPNKHRQSPTTCVIIHLWRRPLRSCLPDVCDHSPGCVHAQALWVVSLTHANAPGFHLDSAGSSQVPEAAPPSNASACLFNGQPNVHTPGPFVHVCLGACMHPSVCGRLDQQAPVLAWLAKFSTGDSWHRTSVLTLLLQYLLLSMISDISAAAAGTAREWQRCRVPVNHPLDPACSSAPVHQHRHPCTSARTSPAYPFAQLTSVAHASPEQRAHSFLTLAPCVRLRPSPRRYPSRSCAISNTQIPYACWVLDAQQANDYAYTFTIKAYLGIPGRPAPCTRTSLDVLVLSSVGSRWVWGVIYFPLVYMGALQGTGFQLCLLLGNNIFPHTKSALLEVAATEQGRPLWAAYCLAGAPRSGRILEYLYQLVRLAFVQYIDFRNLLSQTSSARTTETQTSPGLALLHYVAVLPRPTHGQRTPRKTVIIMVTELYTRMSLSLNLDTLRSDTNAAAPVFESCDTELLCCDHQRPQCACPGYRAIEHLLWLLSALRLNSRFCWAQATVQNRRAWRVRRESRSGKRLARPLLVPLPVPRLNPDFAPLEILKPSHYRVRAPSYSLDFRTVPLSHLSPRVLREEPQDGERRPALLHPIPPLVISPESRWGPTESGGLYHRRHYQLVWPQRGWQAFSERKELKTEPQLPDNCSEWNCAYPQENHRVRTQPGETYGCSCQGQAERKDGSSVGCAMVFPVSRDSKSQLGTSVLQLWRYRDIVNSSAREAMAEERRVREEDEKDGATINIRVERNLGALLLAQVGTYHRVPWCRVGSEYVVQIDSEGREKTLHVTITLPVSQLFCFNVDANTAHPVARGTQQPPAVAPGPRARPLQPDHVPVPSRQPGFNLQGLTKIRVGPVRSNAQSAGIISLLGAVASQRRYPNRRSDARLLGSGRLDGAHSELNYSEEKMWDFGVCLYRECTDVHAASANVWLATGLAPRSVLLPRGPCAHTSPSRHQHRRLAVASVLQCTSGSVDGAVSHAAAWRIRAAAPDAAPTLTGWTPEQNPAGRQLAQYMHDDATAAVPGTAREQRHYCCCIRRSSRMATLPRPGQPSSLYAQRHSSEYPRSAARSNLPRTLGPNYTRLHVHVQRLAEFIGALQLLLKWSDYAQATKVRSALRGRPSILARRSCLGGNRRCLIPWHVLPGVQDVHANIYKTVYLTILVAHNNKKDGDHSNYGCRALCACVAPALPWATALRCKGSHINIRPCLGKLAVPGPPIHVCSVRYQTAALRRKNSYLCCTFRENNAALSGSEECSDIRVNLLSFDFEDIVLDCDEDNEDWDRSTWLSSTPFSCLHRAALSGGVATQERQRAPCVKGEHRRLRVRASALGVVIAPRPYSLATMNLGAREQLLRITALYSARLARSLTRRMPAIRRSPERHARKRPSRPAKPCPHPCLYRASSSCCVRTQGYLRPLCAKRDCASCRRRTHTACRLQCLTSGDWGTICHNMCLRCATSSCCRTTRASATAVQRELSSCNRRAGVDTMLADAAASRCLVGRPWLSTMASHDSHLPALVAEKCSQKFSTYRVTAGGLWGKKMSDGTAQEKICTACGFTTLKSKERLPWPYPVPSRAFLVYLDILPLALTLRFPMLSSGRFHLSTAEPALHADQIQRAHRWGAPSSGTSRTPAVRQTYGCSHQDRAQNLKETAPNCLAQYCAATPFPYTSSGTQGWTCLCTSIPRRDLQLVNTWPKKVDRRASGKCPWNTHNAAICRFATSRVAAPRIRVPPDTVSSQHGPARRVIIPSCPASPEGLYKRRARISYPRIPIASAWRRSTAACRIGDVRRTTNTLCSPETRLRLPQSLCHNLAVTYVHGSPLHVSPTAARPSKKVLRSSLLATQFRGHRFAYASPSGAAAVSRLTNIQRAARGHPAPSPTADCRCTLPRARRRNVAACMMVPQRRRPRVWIRTPGTHSDRFTRPHRCTNELYAPRLPAAMDPQLHLFLRTSDSVAVSLHAARCSFCRWPLSTPRFPERQLRATLLLCRMTGPQRNILTRHTPHRAAQRLRAGRQVHPTTPFRRPSPYAFRTWSRYLVVAATARRHLCAISEWLRLSENVSQGSWTAEVSSVAAIGQRAVAPYCGYLELDRTARKDQATGCSSCTLRAWLLRTKESLDAKYGCLPDAGHHMRKILPQRVGQAAARSHVERPYKRAAGIY